jgi:hypothetical protein
MWPRIAEIAIGVWLMASPWVLAHHRPAGDWPLNELACGLAIVVLASLSFWPPSRKTHLAEILVGLWIVGFTYSNSTYPPSPLVQSSLLSALFLLNFAIIPSQASLPPASWRNFADSQGRTDPLPTNDRTGLRVHVPSSRKKSGSGLG